MDPCHIQDLFNAINLTKKALDLQELELKKKRTLFCFIFYRQI